MNMHELLEEEGILLKRLQGLTVKRVDHLSTLGMVEIHFENGAILSVQAHGRCDTSVVVTGSKED